MVGSSAGSTAAAAPLPAPVNPQNTTSGQNIAFLTPPAHLQPHQGQGSTPICGHSTTYGPPPLLPPPPQATASGLSSNPGQLLQISGGSIPYFISPASTGRAPLSQSEG